MQPQQPVHAIHSPPGFPVCWSGFLLPGEPCRPLLGSSCPLFLPPPSSSTEPRHAPRCRHTVDIGLFEKVCRVAVCKGQSLALTQD